MVRSRTPLDSSHGPRRSVRSPKPRFPPKRKDIPKRRPKPRTPEPPKYVRHKSELEYIKPDWSDEDFIKYFKSHAFDVPPRSSNTSDPWACIRTVDDRTILIPRAYRLPLLIAARNELHYLSNIVPEGPRDWAIEKFDVLYWSRLCATFLDQAEEAANMDDPDRDWRCPMFDRVLTRLYLHWFRVREECVEKFWDLWGEKVYAKDPLKKGR
jgi:hypothetical protein